MMSFSKTFLDDRGTPKRHPPQSSTLNQLYGEGSNHLFQNTRVRTSSPKSRGVTHSMSRLARELEEIRLIAASRGKDEAVRRLQELSNHLTGDGGGSTCATGKAVLKAFAPNPDEIGDSMIWRRFLSYIDEDHEVKELIVFILTGNKYGKFYSKKLRLSLDDVSFVDQMIDNKKGEKILLVLEDLTAHIQQDCFEPLILVYTKCVLTENKEMRKLSYEKINDICDIPPKFFYFVRVVHQRRNQQLAGKAFDKTKNSIYLDMISSGARKRTRSASSQGTSTSGIELIDTTQPKRWYGKKQMIPKTKSNTSCEEVQFKVSVIDIVSETPQLHFNWSRGHRRGTSKFYVDHNKTPSQLLEFLTKYVKGYGLNHKIIIRHAHPKFTCEKRDIKNLITVYILHKFKKFQKSGSNFLEKQPVIDGEINAIFNVIYTLQELSQLNPKKEGDVDKLISIWQEYGKREELVDPIRYKERKHEFSTNAFHLGIEHIPKPFLKNHKVWEEIMVDIPYAVVLENLCDMVKTEVFRDDRNLDRIVSVLTDLKRIVDAKINPIEILIGLRYFERDLPKNWSKFPDAVRIRDALLRTFHLSLKHPDIRSSFACNRRVMLIIDIRQGSDQRSSKCHGAEVLSTFEAAIAFAMMMYNFEEDCHVYTFDSHFTNLKSLLESDITLDAFKQAVSELSPSRPDVLDPVDRATRNRIDTDMFVVLSSSDDFTNRCHRDTLQRYRNEMHRPSAKLVVVGMQCHDFTFAYSNDPSMYDVCGFNGKMPHFLMQIANALN